MAIEKMKLVRVYGLTKHINEFIASCCISGNFHPENAMDYLSDTLGFTPLLDDNPYTAQIQKIEDLAKVAGVILPEKVSTKKVVIDEEELKYVSSLFDKMNEFHIKRSELIKHLEEVNLSIEQFNNFLSVNIPLNELLNCKFVKVRFGSIPRECCQKLNIYINKYNILFVPCKDDGKNYWGIYVAPINEVERTDQIFASLYFRRIKFTEIDGTPKEVVKNLIRKKHQTEKEIYDINKQISEYWDSNSAKCISIYTHFKILSSVYDLRRYAAKDKDIDLYYTYVGYVPESKMKWFEDKIAKIPETHFEIFEPSDDTSHTPPVKLKNPKFARPFEMFVEMYGLPSYDGIDITKFVAITYALLFGIMFADLGQGLVLSVLGYILYKKTKSPLWALIVPCGMCSMLFGFIFGSVFGFEEALDPVYKMIGLNGKILSVMDNVNTVLLLAISIGIALVVISMLLNIHCSLRKKKIGEALFSTNGLTGIILYLSGVVLVCKFMGLNLNISSSILAIVMVLCIVILFMQEILIGIADKKKNYMPESMSDYIMQNFFEVIEYILSYFSNTVSFLRVGAFVLVHAGMMQVFFSLAGEPIGITGMIIIILGNIFVIALEGLLTGIQALRLEFYEMFSRFYEGNGRAFKSVNVRVDKNELQNSKKINKKNIVKA